ncbi:MAG: hypothetical protein AAFX76_06245 [Planctomycetota bacterium]
MPDDVNLSIRRWRDALASRESIGTEQLDELQDHLEAELRRIPLSGISEEERVLLAARRVGAADTVDRAFFEADPGRVWRRRIFWMILGFFVLAEVPAAVLSVFTGIAALALAMPFPRIVVGPWIVAAHVLVWSGLFFVAWRQASGHQGWVDSMARAFRRRLGWALAIVVAVIIAGPFLAGTARFIFHNWMPVEDFGYLYAWAGYSSQLVGLVIPIALGFIAWACMRKTPA